MSPITHLFASWILAAKTTDHPRDCRLVALAGIVPDLDGLGVFVDLAQETLGIEPSLLYPQYHHFLLHGLPGGLFVAVLMAVLARRRLRVLLLTLVVFHLHLFCDLIGARGPDPTDLWPIYYFGPFTHQPMWVWAGQWELNGWPNRLITLALFAWVMGLAVQQGHSFVGVFNRRVDAIFVGVLRKWHAALASQKNRLLSRSGSGP